MSTLLPRIAFVTPRLCRYIKVQAVPHPWLAGNKLSFAPPPQSPSAVFAGTVALRTLSSVLPAPAPLPTRPLSSTPLSSPSFSLASTRKRRSSASACGGMSSLAPGRTTEPREPFLLFLSVLFSSLSLSLCDASFSKVSFLLRVRPSPWSAKTFSFF